MSQAFLHVDISHLTRTIMELRAIHTQREFELLMWRAFSHTGAKVKTILKKEIPKEYHAKPSWIGQNIGPPRTEFGGFGGAQVSCSIPVEGERGVLGRQVYAAGPRGRRPKGKRYKITAQIVKGQKSVLPETLPNQGGNPPFISSARKSGKTRYARDNKGRFTKGNISGNVKGIVFTRKTKNRLPIVRVVARGVPQMPIARSQDAIQEQIAQHLRGRMEHEHRRLINRVRR
jgi:hypothetical protein